MPDSDAGDGRAAGSAACPLRPGAQPPVPEAVTLASDDHFTAGGAVCRTAFGVADVAGIHIMQAVRPRDVPGAPESLGWSE